MTILSECGDKRRARRAASRRSKQNKLFWAEGPESRRLEARTLFTLTITSFPIPLVALVQPDGITTGPDGNLWFTETGADRIGRMTPAGVLTEFPLPAGSTPGSPPGPKEITAGTDGALWFTGIPGEVGRITTAGVVTEFAVPFVPPPAGSPAGTVGTPATLAAITAGPDGALWFTGVPGEVGRITTAGVVTEFAVPDVPPPAGSPAGTAGTPATLSAITLGPDGALWFTGVPGEVGRITTAGVVTEFAVPAVPASAGSPAGAASTLATLNSITAGPDGALWFTGVPDEVGRITTAGVVTEYATPNFSMPSNSSATTTTTGPDGNLWLTGFTAIGRITPMGSFTSFDAPGNFNTIAGLTSGPDGNLWFTEQEDAVTPGEQPAVGEITPAGVTTLYTIAEGTTLDPDRGVPADPTVITTGPDGALWFGENGAIGRITTIGAIQQFPLPAVISAFTGSETVTDITSGPDGAVWFTEQNPGGPSSIGRITTAGAITIYPLSPNSTSAYVTSGPDDTVWFTENLYNPLTSNFTAAIGRITATGKIQIFKLPKKADEYAVVGNITEGPDGNLWFPLSYDSDSSGNTQGLIGKVTAKGSVKMYHVFSSLNKAYGSYPPASPSDIISGPDGKLWYQGTVHGTTGIARISTSGKLDPVIPVDDISSNLVRLPNGQVWFESSSGTSALGVATRSGIVATQDLPSSNPYPVYPVGANAPGMTIGPDGNLWVTSGASSIVRISGLNTVAGALD